jgi:DNA-binding FrmR family transcriptional regulator
MTSSYGQHRKNILTRLRRIEGQLRGIQKMVEDDKYCVDVLIQLSSVIAASQKVGLIILKDHINGCVRNAVKKEDGESYVVELVNVVEKFMKS